MFRCLFEQNNFSPPSENGAEALEMTPYLKHTRTHSYSYGLNLYQLASQTGRQQPTPGLWTQTGVCKSPLQIKGEVSVVSQGGKPKEITVRLKRQCNYQAHYPENMSVL